MKSIFFLLLVGLLAACSKNSGPGSKLEGKWQLSAIFLQTTGTGSWHAEDSIPPNFIQFNHDGSLTMSAYVSSLYGAPTGYTVTGNTAMVFHYPAGNNISAENTMSFQLTDTVLTITPPSMEYVVEKYVRIP